MRLAARLGIQRRTACRRSLSAARFRATGPAGAAAALAELEREVSQLRFREPQRELHRGAFPGRRTQHPGPVAARPARFDQQVKSW